MPNSIVLEKQHTVTYETCAVCGTPNIRIGHGHEEYNTSHFLHLEDCPECGESIVIVGYDCEACKSNEQLH